MRRSGLVLAMACSHAPPVEEPAPLQRYVCSGSMRPPWLDQREGATSSRPFRMTVEATSPGQALAAITAELRADWNRYFRTQNVNQRTPPFPGLIGGSCIAETPHDTTGVTSVRPWRRWDD